MVLNHIKRTPCKRPGFCTGTRLLTASQIIEICHMDSFNVFNAIVCTKLHCIVRKHTLHYGYMHIYSCLSKYFNRNAYSNVYAYLHKASTYPQLFDCINIEIQQTNVCNSCSSECFWFIWIFVAADILEIATACCSLRLQWSLTVLIDR